MIVGRQSRQRRTSGAVRTAALALPTRDGAFRTVIPFDHAATFKLIGEPGNLIQDVINVSSDGVFVAVAIGYALEEERGVPLTISPLPIDPVVPGELLLNQIPPQALIEGFRVNPRFRNIIFNTDPTTDEADAAELAFADDAVPAATIDKVFERIKPPADVSFMFSMVDSSTGRELQDEPTHNLASLGIGNGERPFRPLARPMYFMPRSSMRLQIEERSQGVQGRLFIVLYGYKILSVACPELVTRNLRGPAACPTETIGNPSDRIIPFDYVSKFRLTGRVGHLLEDEVPINVEGGFVATAVGYGMTVENDRVAIADAARHANLGGGGLLDLTQLSLNLFPSDALIDGIRVRPDYLRFVFEGGGDLSAALPFELADEVFERINRPEDLSFRYTFLDSGTGRELQNQPITNVAGLGIANGKRPFKQFVRPLVFLPRSTLRVAVQEHLGRGELFIVFHGYKMLGTSSAVGRS